MISMLIWREKCKLSHNRYKTEPGKSFFLARLGFAGTPQGKSNPEVFAFTDAGLRHLVKKNVLSGLSDSCLLSVWQQRAYALRKAETVVGVVPSFYPD